jgi:glutathione synthase
MLAAAIEVEELVERDERAGGQGGERMRLAFVVDPLDHLKAYKDSRIAMMREAARRGHEIHALRGARRCRARRRGRAPARRLESPTTTTLVPRRREAARSREFDASSCARTRPSTRSTTTRRCCSSAPQAEGTRVVNDPRGAARLEREARDPALPDARTADARRERHGARARLHRRARDVIVKKLDGMGGTMIFRVRRDDVNRNVIVETITDSGARTIMAQRYIPEIAQGDKRVLVIDGKPFRTASRAFPRRARRAATSRAGGRGVAQPISARDREIASRRRELVKAGIVFAGST